MAGSPENTSHVKRLDSPSTQLDNGRSWLDSDATKVIESGHFGHETQKQRSSLLGDSGCHNHGRCRRFPSIQSQQKAQRTTVIRLRPQEQLKPKFTSFSRSNLLFQLLTSPQLSSGCADRPFSMCSHGPFHGNFLLGDTNMCTDCR